MIYLLWLGAKTAEGASLVRWRLAGEGPQNHEAAWTHGMGHPICAAKGGGRTVDAWAHTEAKLRARTSALLVALASWQTAILSQFGSAPTFERLLFSKSISARGWQNHAL